MHCFENMIDTLSSGYSDEWEIRNTHTGARVDITDTVHRKISNYCKEQLCAIEKDLERISE